LLSAACALLLLTSAAWSAGPGDIAPEFALTDFNGKAIRLADLRGKLVLLNFWASWCAPCLEEMPRLSAWQRDYGAAGLQVIGISMDDEAAPARRQLAKQPVGYPVALGDEELARRYGGILGLPQSFLIDRRGRVLARYKGEVDLGQVEATIKTQLSAPQ
jgi:cytochrome c biogenesis protein CcmG/thiol:disulfide interchange protein DsbE